MIEKVEGFAQYGKAYDFFLSDVSKVSEIFGNKFDHKGFDFLRYANLHHVWVCYKNGEPVGIMMAQLFESVFDSGTKILMQDLLYAKPGSGRAAHSLMQHFIAFGKKTANHIITMRGKNTNIKAGSLKKLGFEEIEVHYRLEV